MTYRDIILFQWTFYLLLGDFPGWDYTITKPVGETVATVSKELLQWTDTYVLDIVDPADALHVLMFVLAIDAEKCSAK